MQVKKKKFRLVFKKINGPLFRFTDSHWRKCPDHKSYTGNCFILSSKHSYTKKVTNKNSSTVALLLTEVQYTTLMLQNNVFILLNYLENYLILRLKI